MFFLLGYNSPPEGIFSTQLQNGLQTKDFERSWAVKRRGEGQLIISEDHGTGDYELGERNTSYPRPFLWSKDRFKSVNQE